MVQPRKRSLVAILGRVITLFLVVLLTGERVAFAVATPDSASAKLQISARGAGQGVKVHEANGTVLRGKIVSLGENSFVMQVGAKPVIEIPFADVRAVDGPGLSKKSKAAIWVGAGVLAFIVIVTAAAASAFSHWN